MNEIIYKTWENKDNLNLLNKCVHFYESDKKIKNNTIYKITKETKNYLTLQELIINKKFRANISLYNAEHTYNYYYHFKDKLIDRKIRKKKENLPKLFIINDISDYYLINNELFNNYKNSPFKCDTSIIKFSAFIYRTIKNIHNNLKKLNDKRIKKYVDKLYNKMEINYFSNFKYFMIYSNIYEDYLDILLEYNKQYYEEIKNNFQILYNESCAVCLIDNKKIYNGFYKCCHYCCASCFQKWKKRTCPLCRAEQKL